jgi:predicted nucleic acid-binding protein
VIVVDTNIIAYLYLDSEHTARAEALLQRDPEWAVPPLWRSEFRNILAGCIRRKSVGFEDARQMQAEAQDLMAGSEHDIESHEVLKLVRDSDCSAYDCEFVALAEQLGVKLVTMDSKLLKAFPKRAVPLPAA